ncbi:hypothetical protein AB1484_29755 [Parafrankia sp. FMc6]|uniref:hypothetical protein n=1 Tax=Parafrankia soli TaxID=2599596 RepID=UPI0034D3F738
MEERRSALLESSVLSLLGLRALIPAGHAAQDHRPSRPVVTWNSSARVAVSADVSNRAQGVGIGTSSGLASSCHT